MAEINLMDQYPRTKRSLAQRQEVTDHDRQLACQFGRDYFDGDRKHGYGGYSYQPRFWQATVRRIQKHYNLPENARILDVGCAKGFMLYDFQQFMPKAQLTGIDVSSYAIEHASPAIRPFLRLGNVKSLPYPAGSFDLVTAINTIHNLDLADCKQALREIQRVSQGRAFIVVDAWRTPEQQRMLKEWILTAKTYLHVDDWVNLFHEVGYTGDYYWFFFE
jgi:ubiquinone/menaquinone biosynthesis C-methylase UbiE